MVLFKLFGFIEINYQIIISFFVGIVVGIELFLLFYALIFLISIRNKKVIQKSIDDTEIEAKAKDLIESSRIALSDKVLRGDLSKGKHFKNVCFDLIYGISSTFYPDSKYPQLELTISEAISLLTYIQDRLNKILDKRFIRIVKNRKLSFIWEVTHVTNDAINSNTFKTAKKVKKISDKITYAINIINPFKWISKFFAGTAVAIIKNKLYDIALQIVGEEAYKIYGKSVLNKDVEIESDVNLIVDEIETEIKDLKNDVEKEETKDNFDVSKNYKMKSKTLKIDDKKLNIKEIFSLDYSFKVKVEV